MKLFYKRIFEWIDAILYAAVIVTVLYLVFWPLKVDGSSMENTFFSDDKIIVSRVLSLFPLSHDDIIVCNIYEDSDSDPTAIIKRIVAMPYDHLEIINGIVYVNGEQIEQDHVKNIIRDNLDIILGEDEYFIMGDNRALSKDSRHIGPVKRHDITAKVVFY